MRLNSSAPAQQGKGKGKGKGAGKGAGTAFKGTRRVSTQPRPSRLWQLCWAGMRARRGLDGSSGRWLVAYAHASNGLANRLAGLRGALGLAQASERNLVIRWHGPTGQEGAALRPAGAPGSAADWASLAAPGLGSEVRQGRRGGQQRAADAGPQDAWAMSGVGRDRRNEWSLPKQTRAARLPVLYNLSTAQGRRALRAAERSRAPLPSVPLRPGCVCSYEDVRLWGSTLGLIESTSC